MAPIFAVFLLQRNEQTNDPPVCYRSISIAVPLMHTIMKMYVIDNEEETQLDTQCIVSSSNRRGFRLTIP